MYFGAWFFKAVLLSFCRCSFLSLKLTLLSKAAFGEGKVGLTMAYRTAQHSGHPETWGGSETCLQVCFQGWEESGQLCSLAEGFGLKHCVVTSLALF